MLDQKTDNIQVHVPDSEVARLMGIPADAALDESTLSLIQRARDWHETHVKPWCIRKYFAINELTDASVLLENGTLFNSPALAQRFSATNVHAIVVYALSAGPEMEAEARRRMERDAVDDWFVFDAYASALVESLRAQENLKLCEWANEKNIFALSSYGPGYDGWPLEDMGTLYALLNECDDQSLEGRLSMVDESSMMLPMKSTILVVGLSRNEDLVNRYGLLPPCASCSLAGCSLRRAPYEPSTVPAQPNDRAIAENEVRGKDTEGAVAWTYAFPEKALKRWSSELMHLELGEDDRGFAHFKYHGALCSHTHPKLVLDFKVEISHLSNGCRIETATCVPADEDEGADLMCAAQSAPPAFLAELADYGPLIGQPLVDALQWTPEMNPAGCVCTRPGQDDKWLMVYQTLLYKLREEKGSVVLRVAQEVKA